MTFSSPLNTPAGQYRAELEALDNDAVAGKIDSSAGDGGNNTAGDTDTVPDSDGAFRVYETSDKVANGRKAHWFTRQASSQETGNDDSPSYSRITRSASASASASALHSQAKAILPTDPNQVYYNDNYYYYYYYYFYYYYYYYYYYCTSTSSTTISTTTTTTTTTTITSTTTRARALLLALASGRIK